MSRVARVAARVAAQSLAVVPAAALVASACAFGSGAGGDNAATAASAESGASQAQVAVADDPVALRPVVEVPAPATGVLESGPGDAAPSTALGELRARHLPVWTSEFDWAFPPHVCHTAWELDAIAEPNSDADVLAMGDYQTAAALTVMRYEYQLSRALADPSALAQLCVATATVEPRRTEDLEVLTSYIESGVRRSEPAAYPTEIVLVGASESEVVAVACVVPGYSDVVGADGSTVEPARAPARLLAYRLSVSRGLEDRVADVSYRVAQAVDRAADNCDDLDSWLAEWDHHVRQWIAEGRVWVSIGRVLTADGICDSPPSEGPTECPRDWPR